MNQDLGWMDLVCRHLGSTLQLHIGWSERMALKVGFNIRGASSKHRWAGGSGGDSGNEGHDVYWKQ